MGRIRQFDREAVMDKALKLFWLNGFDRTSLDDLLKTMEIKNSSFYQAFQSKEKLFLEVVARYRDTFSAPRWEVLMNESLSARESLEGYFKHAIFGNAERGFPMGCFMTNTWSSLVDADSKVGEEALWSLRKIEKNFVTVLNRAEKSGESLKAISPADGAKLLVMFLSGLTSLSRTGKTKKELMNSVTKLIDLILKKKA